MTQPIQEPSTDRALQGFAYARDQIFRRPAPVAGGESEVPYATMWWPGAASIVDDTIVTVNEDETGVCYMEGYINAAGLAMTPEPFNFDFCEGKIQFNSPGYYIAQFIVNWADTFPTPGPSYLGTVIDYFGGCPTSIPCGDWISTDVMFNSQDWMQFWETVTAHVISDTDDEETSWFRGRVIQKSGGAKDLSGAALIVAKIADYTAGTGEFFISGT